MKIIEVVQNKALRICLGAFCTSPVVSLQVEANEPPLTLRRLKLSMQYATSLQANPSNPAYSAVNHTMPAIRYEEQHVTPAAGARILPCLQEAGINVEGIRHSKLPVRPLGLIKGINVNTNLSTSSKFETPDAEYMSRFLETRSEQYPQCVEIYTDGSKMNNKVAAAVHFRDNKYGELRDSFRLPDGSSIYSA